MPMLTRMWRFCRRAVGARRIAWFGATILALEGVYLVAGNLYLNFGLAPMASTSPDTVEMRIEGAFSWLPTTAHVRHYHLRAQDSVIQWTLDVEDADLTVDLFALLHQKFHATRVRAKTCVFRLRRKLDDDGARSPRAFLLPPVPGFSDPPMKEIGPSGPPPTDADYHLWTAELEDVSTGVDEIWIDEFRLSGPAHVVGSFFFKPLRMLQIGPMSLQVVDGELRVGGSPTLRGIDMDVASTVGLIHVGEPLTRAVREISMTGHIDAELADVDFLRLYLPERFPVELEEGGGSVHVGLRLANGYALPPTSMRIESDRLVLRSAPLLSVLDLTAEAHVKGSASGPVATGSVRAHDASVIRRDSDASPIVVDALARLRGLPTDLAAYPRIEHTHVDAATKNADVAILLPAAKRGHPRAIGVDGRADAHLEADLDHDLRGAGRVEGTSKRIRVSSGTFEAAAAVAVKASFDGADLDRRTLRLLPSLATLDDVVVTRDGRAHRGGALRLELKSGAVHRGVLQDVELGLSGRFSDLGWLASSPNAKGSYAALDKGAFDARLTIPRPGAIFDGTDDSAFSGSIDVRASAEGRFQDVALRGDVAATTVIQSLDLSRRAFVLGQTHVDLRDVEIQRGDDRTEGWWASMDASPLEGKALGPLALATHVDLHAQSGKPFLAALASTGTIPGWVGGLFPMNDLRATANVSRWRDDLQVGLGLSSTSMKVRARLYDVGSATDGAILVQTPIVSVGVRLDHGESHTKIFAGESWLKEQLSTVRASSTR